MATLERLNQRHEEYIGRLTGILQDVGFIVDRAGLEDVAHNIDASGIRMDFSLEALKQRCRPDLQVWHPETKFFFYVDAKTVMIRNDTGNVAIEVWPILQGRQEEIPRLLAFEVTGTGLPGNGTGLWIDRIKPSWLETVFMPLRWSDSKRRYFEDAIRRLTPSGSVYFRHIPWNRKSASGDPFYVWPIKWINKVDVTVQALRRAYEKDISVTVDKQLTLF